MEVRICNFEARTSSSIFAGSVEKVVAAETSSQERSMGEPVAVTSTGESKDYHIHLSNDKMTPAGKQSKS